MRVFKRPSAGTALGFTAIMIALGGTALAATGQLVHIADRSDATRLARVDSAGRVGVTDLSGAVTVDGTVLAHEATPANFFRTNRSAFSDGTCKLLVAPPTGRALIVKAVHVDTAALGTAQPTFFEWLVGTDCATAVAADDHDPAQKGMTVVPYEPGLAVPNGKSLFGRARGSGVMFLASVVGYTVPASAVPAGGGVLGSAAATAAEAR